MSFNYSLRTADQWCLKHAVGFNFILITHYIWSEDTTSKGRCMLHVLGILNTKSMLNRCIGNMCLFFHKKGNLISRHISVSLIISSDDGCGILERENTGYGFLRDLSAPPSITSMYLVWDWELSLWAIILESMLMFEGIFYFF